MANETILIVDADTKSQKVLEVSFKKAGYRVVMTEEPARAREVLKDVAPDLVISDTQFPSGGDGFEFLADMKAGAFRAVPFIFLTEERALPRKMKGFELGADDYLTKPIYIKEVTTRVELLLQKRAKEQLTEENVEEIEGNVADITMIDLLQTIEDELRSGTIHLNRDGQSAVIYFREGNILDAICGKLQGEEAIYRMMLWPDGTFVLRYHEQVRRVDRIEKDSGALLLEGIRRLEQYNELSEQLPDVHRVFEADYQRLSSAIDQLPEEVSRIMRLFDGVRSIREVADNSPVDDVTTFKIVQKLLDDQYLFDVTPRAKERVREHSRSNLAAWLDGVRSAEAEQGAGIAREYTSPKFGASISEMAERRTEKTDAASAAAADKRDASDTDPFGSRAQAREPSPRETAPLPEAAERQTTSSQPRAKRRSTMLQWDRPRSEWNIHFDAPEDANAAIREIEEEERRRREQEAQQLSGEHKPVEPTYNATLRYAPAQDRNSGGASQSSEQLRKIEEDEQRRRDHEARHLQAQMATFRPRDAEDRAPRRHTDELPLQPRPPAIVESEERLDTDELFADGLPELRKRSTTPLSSPAVQRDQESAKRIETAAAAAAAAKSERPPDAAAPRLAKEKALGDGWEALAPPEVETTTSAGDAVSEADVFDDSDEVDRVGPPPAPAKPVPTSERVTRNLRPATKLSPLAEPSEPQVDDAGLFDNLGDEETSPGGDETMDSIEIEVIEVLPSVQRQATDTVLVETTYDLSRRKSILPSEVEGRPEAVAERVTRRLRAPAYEEPEKSPEQAFFADRQEDGLEYEEQRGGSGGAVIAIIGLGILAIVALMLWNSGAQDVGKPDDKVAVVAPPTQTIAVPPPLVPAPPPGMDEPAATERAGSYGSEVGASASQLTTVLSGTDLLPPDAGQPIEVGVAPVEPPVDTPPVEKPPLDIKPVEKPPVDSPPVDKPPVDKPPADPVDTKPPEKISEATSAAVAKAERLVKQEKYDEALNMLRQLSQAAPNDKKVAYLHGLAAFSTNKTGEAVTHLSRAERLGYRTAPLYLDLGAAYQLDGKHSQAKWAYEKFLELQPNGRQADEVRTILSTRF